MSKCSFCHAVFSGEKECPDCGTELRRFGKKIETEDAELKEVGKKATVAEKRVYLGMLKYYVRTKGYNEKMINAKYKNAFGCWAHHSISDVAPIEPDNKFLNRMKHEQIRWAKSKRQSA